MTDHKMLEVYYHDSLVGYLAQTPDHLVAFQYSDDWLRNGFSISPLSLPLSNNVFVPPGKCRDRFKGMFGVFADSLPDSWGELLLDRHLEACGAGKDDISALDRLAYVGRSGMGALEYHPSKEADFYMESVGLSYDEIAEDFLFFIQMTEDGDSLPLMILPTAIPIGENRPHRFAAKGRTS